MPITGTIYKISSEQTDRVYVGSTTLPILTRFSVHKSHFKRWNNEEEGVGYCASFEIMQFDDADVEILEQAEMENRMELRALEQIWLDRTPNIVNVKKAVLTPEQKQEYIAARLQKIKCECGGSYSITNLKHHRSSSKHSRYVLKKQIERANGN